MRELEAYFFATIVRNRLYAPRRDTMAVRDVVFVVMLCILAVNGQSIQPDCDDKLIEPIFVRSEEIPFDLPYAWQESRTSYGLRVATGKTQPHVWFCPTTDASLMRQIIKWKCPKGCKDYKPDIGGYAQIGTKIMRMSDCLTEIESANVKNRIKTCMPWEENDAMTHFRKQFLSFEADPNAAVSECVNTGISFSRLACWHQDSSTIVLKPQYKFNYASSANKKVCTVSQETAKVQMRAAASYDISTLGYTPHTVGEQFAYCQYMGRDPAAEVMKYIPFVSLFHDLVPVEVQTRKMQFYDYKLGKITADCPDFVTEPCLDNAFSLFGKACQWVDAAKKSAAKPQDGVILQDLLSELLSSDVANFKSYGGGMYVMNVKDSHIEVSVSGLPVSGLNRAVPWDGTARAVALTDRLVVSMQSGFSCSGCPEYAQAPKYALKDKDCGKPHECVACGAWQRVDLSSGWLCDATVQSRACVECPKHQNRTEQKLDPRGTSCQACPPLIPTRRVGDEKCTQCEHTQYFDVSQPAGCMYLKSVADGLSFSPVSFSAAAVDEFMSVVEGISTRKRVPARQYRNLMDYGNAWNTSTQASVCAESGFFSVNDSSAGIFTRNVHYTRIQYRRWCGHEEILRSTNAQLRLLECPRKSTSSSASVSVPDTISLQDLFNFSTINGYALKQERVHVNTGTFNRVAEVTLATPSVDCHYEIRREGQPQDCTYCPGTQFTQNCGPTYNALLSDDAVTQAGPGTCGECARTCPNKDYFFTIAKFSCWSNGTLRVTGANEAWHGRLDEIGKGMAPYMNYWYKQALCSACENVQVVDDVPFLVTRCGNKASFETWHPTLRVSVLEVVRPLRRFCCALDSAANDKAETQCVNDGLEAQLFGPTGLCMQFVADLQTELSPFCPPGWFFDSSFAYCKGKLDKWNNACCSQCKLCSGAGLLQTNEYKVCPGDTAEDTQLAGCVTSCAEKNFQVNDTCVACESCA